MFRGLASISLLAVSLLVLVGCEAEPDPSLRLMDTNLGTTKVDDLSRTMEWVFERKQFEMKEFSSRVSTTANRWATSDVEKFESDGWAVDSMAKGLVEKLADKPFVAGVNEINFSDDDAFALQQAAWCSKIAKRVANEKNTEPFEMYRIAADNYRPSEDTDDPVVEIVAKLHPNLEPANATKLAKGLKLFDWICRNIQLEKETEQTEEFITKTRLNDSDSEFLADAGVPGTGYQRHPYQTVLYGRGDYVERAKVFITVAHQVELDVVMLATKDAEGKKTPWLPALIVGDNQFLFDTKMGLAVPGKKLGSIATLAEVQADPAMIESLDLTLEESLADQTDYWVRPEQLNDVSALIYASPESLSRRFWDIEKFNVGEYMLPLVFQPTRIAELLPAGMEKEFWSIEFETHLYRDAVEVALNMAVSNNELRDRTSWYPVKEGYIVNFPTYRSVRAVFIHGRFLSERKSRRINAIEGCFNLMYTDEAISGLAADKTLQERHGILKDNRMTVKEHQDVLSSVQGQMRLISRDFNFFLAQVHFDSGNVGTAANWLERVQNKVGIERWSTGVNYLLGRAYESRKDYDKATDTYGKKKDSPQIHGNLIRARLLSQAVDTLR